MTKGTTNSDDTLKRRRKGRPSNSGRSVGRDALIATACDLLRTTKPRLITRALVARATNVDPSLISYYFQNNTALLIAAAEKLTTEYIDSLEKAIGASDGRPENRLKARVGTLLDLNARYPYFHQLIVEEILPSNNELARRLMVSLTQRGTEGYNEILSEGYRDGGFRHVDPDLLFSSIVGLCESYFYAKQAVDIARCRMEDGGSAKDKYKNFICDLILNGIETSAVRIWNQYQSVFLAMHDWFCI